jgi:hypothetical protein
MASANPAVLLCGDVTDSWVDGIDHLYAQINTTPWLRSFLEDLFLAFQAEMKGMEPLLRDSFGLCSDFQELAQRYRRSRDPVGIVHALLLYAVRASQLLEFVIPVPFFACLHVSCTNNTAKRCKSRTTVAQPK